MTGDHTAFLYSEDFLKYRFGETHPYQSRRGKCTKEMLEGLGIFGDQAIVFPTQPAREEDLLMVHTIDHVEYVKKKCEAGRGTLDLGDTPATATLYEGSLAAVGASLDGVDGILQGRFLHAFNPGGGHHHARSNCSAGFCVFNDVALAVRDAQRRHGLERIAVIDTDAHHGDGTQSIFYNEKVLTVSLHHYTKGFYPGTGSPGEVGYGYGAGYSINVPLPSRTGDDTYLKAYQEIAVPALREYRPELIIHQFGVDGHFTDPLVGLGLSTHGYERLSQVTHDAAHELCNGEYLVVGGGGYNPEAATRCWAIMFCTISGVYPHDRSRYEALHDKSVPKEPPGVAEEVGETVDRIRAEVLPLIR